MPCRPAISSMSLGRCYAGHSIEHKLSAAAKHGLKGIELFYEDLADLARPATPCNLLSAAAYIRSLCTEYGLEIICLQPFMHYDGLVDRAKHAERIAEVKLWIELAKVLRTDTIQVPSSFLPEAEVSADFDVIVSDLRELADLGAQQTPIVRFAYESLCWGTRVDKWEQCWEIVQRVDRPNVGICLDSFNILGRIYADPTSPSGTNANAAREVELSVERLVKAIKPYKEKIFFIQIVDAERLETPLRPGHSFYVADQPARMSWSRNCRLFYGERDRGAYLPVRDVAHAIINEIGYDGWISMELFNRVMERSDEGVVGELAARAMEGWRKMVVDLKMKVDPETMNKSNPISRKDRSEGVFEKEAEVARL
jgi:4-hydroxyphenylpyruvate dioxygenase